MIQQCLEICPCLTIGVISDEIIRERKKHYPAVNEMYRFLLLSVLYPECEVLMFKHKFDSDFYNQFDFIFVSSDMAGKKFYFIPDDYAGEIVYIPRTDGISSSDIRHNILWGD